MGIEMDMAKAYDKLELRFIKKNTLIYSKFTNRLNETIINCIAIVSFSLLINGYPIKSFSPSIGIR